MNRHVVIALGLLATIPISDWLADQQIAKERKARQHHEEVGYPASSVEALNRMSADAGVAFELPPSPSKLVYRWANKRAALIAEAYSLRPEDLDTTVDVRRMK